MKKIYILHIFYANELNEPLKCTEWWSYTTPKSSLLKKQEKISLIIMFECFLSQMSKSLKQ